MTKTRVITVPTMRDVEEVMEKGMVYDYVIK